MFSTLHDRRIRGDLTIEVYKICPAVNVLIVDSSSSWQTVDT